MQKMADSQATTQKALEATKAVVQANSVARVEADSRPRSEV